MTATHKPDWLSHKAEDLKYREWEAGGTELNDCGTRLTCCSTEVNASHTTHRARALETTTSTGPLVVVKIVGGGPVCVAMW